MVKYKEYYQTHKEKYKEYYETHKEEILKKQMERYYEKKEKERLRMEQREQKGTDKPEIECRFLKENEKYLVFTVHTMSGKQIGYEVRKRTLTRNEWGIDRWSFSDEQQMEEWIEYGKLIH